MIFIRVLDGVIVNKELDIGDIDDSQLGDLITHKSLYKVVDVTVFDSTLQKPIPPISYSLNGTFVEKLNTVVDKTLSELRAEKYQEIKNNFNSDSLIPVSDASGREWVGGIDSALKIDSVKRLMQLAGQTTVTLFDVHNGSHVVTIAEAESIIITIGIEYQTKYTEKQALILQVQNATTANEIYDIVV